MVHIAPDRLVGHRVLDEDGQNVGKIKQVYLDDQTGEPTWVSVHTGLFGMRETLVPLQGAEPVEEDIQVPFDKATVKDAPQIAAEQQISPDEEVQVREYYARHGGVPRQRGGDTDRTGGAPSAGGTAPGQAAAGVPGQGAQGRAGEAGAMGGAETERGAGREEARMVRHEEQVDIGVERRESGRASMRRNVETERFDKSVPVHHEELEVERRPITDPSQVEDTGQMEDEETTFTLYEEHPVVSKKEVPVEEVRVRKRDVTEEEHVEGERRRERIDFEEEGGRERINMEDEGGGESR